MERLYPLSKSQEERTSESLLVQLGDELPQLLKEERRRIHRENGHTAFRRERVWQQTHDWKESAIIASTPISASSFLFPASLPSFPQQYTSSPLACSYPSRPSSYLTHFTAGAFSSVVHATTPRSAPLSSAICTYWSHTPCSHCSFDTSAQPDSSSDPHTTRPTLPSSRNTGKRACFRSSIRQQSRSNEL